MHGNKSPGPDGLTTEFYQTFWSEIEGVMVDLFNSNFEYGEMTPSQKDWYCGYYSRKKNESHTSKLATDITSKHRLQAVGHAFGKPTPRNTPRGHLGRSNMWYSRTNHIRHGSTITRHRIRRYSKGYAGANCKIINKGWFSESISLDHGVCQGCPLSPLLNTFKNHYSHVLGP